MATACRRNKCLTISTHLPCKAPIKPKASLKISELGQRLRLFTATATAWFINHGTKAKERWSNSIETTKRASMDWRHSSLQMVRTGRRASKTHLSQSALIATEQRSHFSALRRRAIRASHQRTPEAE